MKSCRDLDSLLTPYVDGEVSPEQCVAIEAHLAGCPTCRSRAEAEAGGRAVLRRCRERLREPAPASLHATCRKIAEEAAAGATSPVSADAAAEREWADQAGAAARADAGPPSLGPHDAQGQRAYGDEAAAVAGASSDAGTGAAPRARAWRWWAPVSLAATLLLAIAGVVGFGLVSERSTALAQILATDHLRCVRLVTGRPPADRAQMEERWLKTRGWAIALPPSSSQDDMEFIALRRCLHGGGEMAHALYRHKGRFVSLFIFPDDGQWKANREIMGQRTAVWNHQGRTYAVVDEGSSAEVERLVEFFSHDAE